MMNPLHALIVLLLGLFFLACILWAVYRQKLRIVYSLLWLIIAAIVLCTPWLYTLCVWLHQEADWPTPTSQIFLLGILLLLLLVFHLSMVVSTLWRRQRLLVRQVALLEARLTGTDLPRTGPSAPAAAPASDDLPHLHKDVSHDLQ